MNHAKNFLNLETAERIGKIKDELDEIFQALEGQYNPKFTLDPCPTPGDMIDLLANLKCEIEAKSDGRPKPLDFSATHGPSMEVIERMNDETKACMQDENEGLRTWARCESFGFGEKASIGGMTFGMEQLVLIREWVSRVIEWHLK